MRSYFALILAAALAASAAPLFADEGQPASNSSTPAASGSYQENVKHDLVRGLKNIVGAPLEIPITIQEYHEKAGRPVIRHIAGFIDGSWRGALRLGSGLWDFVAAWIPDHQEGMPVDPETRF